MNEWFPTRMGTSVRLLLLLCLALTVSISAAEAAGFVDPSFKRTASTSSSTSRYRTPSIGHAFADQNTVVFVPGDGGSQLEAKLNKTNKVHYICDTQTDWYDIWLNIHLLAPVLLDCTIDNMRLTYDPKTRTTRNTDGVLIRPTNFGSLASVAYLDVYNVWKTDYFERIASTLEAKNKLIRDVEMKGAPFDFRKAPNELEEFFTNLTDLIVDQYIDNNYRPVTLICHSMGCLNTVHLLNKQSQNWKDVYVRRVIALGAPWGGSFKAITSMLFGDNLGVPVLSSYKLQALQSTLPSLMYLFPTNLTYADNATIIQTNEKNYSLSNFDDFFKLIGMQDQMDMWHDTHPILANLRAPNVELWCLYGSGQPTPVKVVYEDVFKRKYAEIEGDGDGTVNLESLRACEKFQKDQEKPVFTREFEGLDHIDILRDQKPADFISQIMSGDLVYTMQRDAS